LIISKAGVKALSGPGHRTGHPWEVQARRRRRPVRRQRPFVPVAVL